MGRFLLNAAPLETDAEAHVACSFSLFFFCLFLPPRRLNLRSVLLPEAPEGTFVKPLDLFYSFLWEIRGVRTEHQMLGGGGGGHKKFRLLFKEGRIAVCEFLWTRLDDAPAGTTLAVLPMHFFAFLQKSIFFLIFCKHNCNLLVFSLNRVALTSGSFSLKSCMTRPHRRKSWK